MGHKKYYQSEKNNKKMDYGMNMDYAMKSMDYGMNEIFPRDVKYSEYPKSKFINDQNYVDDIYGIDKFKNDIVDGINRNPSKIKY